ncbi:RNA polymerase sigma factor [Aggregatimonas sangjinii]|uniref:RNA polymerase sigma factor n=1 Tax=Aggregatimonas sangjinii TaxID=2583587 RepID=A0A5B7SY43_9FLAO|nr:RNA polymerase sigma factor [Aggregatimonas sangjinii]QCX01674.1 RNA polymerase sigma factor [Aggregatimonas sangjinii]
MTSDNENHNKLGTFFKEEYHSLRSYTKSRIDDTADSDAEDIIQDVALKLFSRPVTASPIHNIAGFVYHSIRNRITDIMRTKKTRIPIEDSMETRLLEFTELLYGKSDNGYSEDMGKELKKAIVNLKPIYRNIITAIDFEGFTYSELSSEIGIPEGTLMSQRHRAIALLFKELKTKKETTN